MAAPTKERGQARGPEASESVVALYKFVYNAGQPVSLEEIVDRGLPPAFRSHAYQAWAAMKEADEGMTVVDQHWDVQSNKDLAWRWWVNATVKAMLHSKRLSVQHRNGGKVGGNTADADRLYSVGQHAPHVKYPDGKMRPWSPELDREYERAVAGMRVTQNADEVLKAVQGIPDKALRQAAIKFVNDAMLVVKP